MDEDTERTLDAVGGRLRAAREARGLTLVAVSATTGISVSTLSRLESGGRRATLELVLPLARCYGVPLDELVGAPEIGDPRVHGRPLTRPDGQIILPLSRGDAGVRAYKHVIPAGVAPPRQRVHAGHEWLYVVTGRLRLRLGDREFVIEAGEAVEFDTRTPHAFGTDADPAEIIGLFSPSGQRMHVADLQE